MARTTPEPLTPDVPIVCPSLAPTVLPVEPNPDVRALAAVILRRAGCAVLEAAGGEDALRLVDGHTRAVALLVAEVFLPGGRSARDLAGALLTRHPGLKVLYLSSAGAVAAEHLVRGDDFLSKPFLPRTLTDRVGRLLAR